MDIHKFFEQGWKDYIESTPSAQRVKTLLEGSGETIVNDHIALRTFDHYKVNIDILAKYFEGQGYEARGEYNFEKKKLFAKHYEHKTDKSMPKVFISELMLSKCSVQLQDIILEVIECLPDDIDTLKLFSQKVYWKPEYDKYKTLYKESEYAAWMYAMGYRPNHFTVSINHLKNINSVEQMNQFLKDHKFQLNEAGGEIKGSVEDLLEQSSILADKKKVQFKKETYEIPTCYYEFALRHKMTDGNLYQGFVATSADKIFESTN